VLLRCVRVQHLGSVWREILLSLRVQCHVCIAYLLVQVDPLFGLGQVEVATSLVVVGVSELLLVQVVTRVHLDAHCASMGFRLLNLLS